MDVMNGNKEKKQLDLTDIEIYTLYEAVENNITNLSYKYKDLDTGLYKKACKSGKYQSKYDCLLVLSEKLHDLIEWDKPCEGGMECVAK